MTWSEFQSSIVDREFQWVKWNNNVIHKYEFLTPPNQKNKKKKKKKDKGSTVMNFTDNLLVKEIYFYHIKLPPDYNVKWVEECIEATYFMYGDSWQPSSTQESIQVQ